MDLLPRPRAATQLQSVAMAALALVAALYSQCSVVRGAGSDFGALGAVLLATAGLQLIVRLVSAQARGRGFGAVGSVDVQSVAWNAARIAAQSWVRLDALHHFGLPLAVLLENVDALLLQPLADQYANRSTTAVSAWVPALAGFLLVAGVDAREYGSLLHAVVLIALALAAKLGEHRCGNMKVQMATTPYFQELSLLAAAVFALPTAWLARWQTRPGALFDDEATAGNSEPMSQGVLMSCVLLAAGFQLMVMHFGRQDAALSSSPQRWQSVVACVGTGLLGSVVVTVADEGAWLRGCAELAAALVVLYPQYAQLRRNSAQSSFPGIDSGVGGSDYLDMYRVVASQEQSMAMRVVSSLWEKDDSRKILLFLSVNVSYMFVELFVGVWTNSLGLIGDAGHMLFDNSALVIGLVASYIGKLPPDEQFTYGYGRVEVLSGFLNSMLLLFISFHLLTEAASRFFDPPEVSTDHLLLTSVVGLLVNIVGLVWFHDHVHSHGHGGECGHGHGHTHSHGHGHGHGHGDADSRGHGHSHGHSHNHQSHGEEEGRAAQSSSGRSASNSNMYGVYLHVLADTLGSVGVIVSSLLIQFKDWHIADPLSSAMIALLIFASTLPLLKETLLQLLQRVPRDKERDVAAALLEVQTNVAGVTAVERWNVWQHAHEIYVGSLHLVVASSADDQVVMEQCREIFRKRAGIGEYLSIQVRRVECPLPRTVQSDWMRPHSHSEREHACHHHEGHVSRDEPIMSTHENPVSEDIRFGRTPPHDHMHRHHFSSDATEPASIGNHHEVFAPSPPIHSIQPMKYPGTASKTQNAMFASPNYRPPVDFQTRDFDFVGRSRHKQM